MSAQLPHLLDYADLAEVLRLRTRDGGGWSAEAARKLVERTPELEALALHVGDRSPRWYLADVIAWARSQSEVGASRHASPGKVATVQPRQTDRDGQEPTGADTSVGSQLQCSRVQR